MSHVTRKQKFITGSVSLPLSSFLSELDAASIRSFCRLSTVLAVVATVFVLSGCSASASQEDLFVDATSDIACATQQNNLDVRKDSADSQPLKNGKELEAAATSIAKRYGFDDLEELNSLARKYKNNEDVLSRTRQKIQQRCPST